MDREHCRRELSALIEHQIDGARDLLVAFDVERNALASRDSDALEEAGSRKQILLEQLESLETRRRQLADAGDHSREEDFAALLVRRGDPALSARWNELLSIIEKCREANDVNGALLRLQRQAVDALMDLLTGRSKEGAVYGASGEASVASIRGSLAKI